MWSVVCTAMACFLTPHPHMSNVRTQRIAGDGFQTPIDEIDAAARILDPVMVGLNHDELHFGVFFKDYRLTEW